MPSRSATSRSYRRCSVVQAVPRPRARAASMKLHAAGSIDPYRPASSRLLTPGRSTRPSMQGITITGTSCMRSAGYWADAATRGSCTPRVVPLVPPAPALRVVVPGFLVQLTDDALLVRVGDDHPLPALGVAPGRRLDGDLQALKQDLARDRPIEIEALSYRTSRGEDVVRVHQLNCRPNAM